MLRIVEVSRILFRGYPSKNQYVVYLNNIN